MKIAPVSDVMVLDRVGELVAPVPGEEETSRPSCSISRVLPRVVPQHRGVPERVGERQLDLDHVVLVQVEGQSDLGVSRVGPVDRVQHPAHDEHVRHQVVVQGDVPRPDQLHVRRGDLHHQGVVVLLHGHDRPETVLIDGEVDKDVAAHLGVKFGQELVGSWLVRDPPAVLVDCRLGAPINMYFKESGEMKEKKTHLSLLSTPRNDKTPLVLGGEIQFHDGLLRLVVVDEGPIEDHVGAPRERKVQFVNSC